MSKESEEKLKKLNDWKKDLDWKAEQWVHDHPEKIAPKVIPVDPGDLPPNTSIQKYEGARTFVMPNMVVGVYESSIHPGTWEVSVNKKVVFISTGPLAHMNALKFADGYLDRSYKESSTSGMRGSIASSLFSKTSKLPESCIFCGGRYLHRLDCPDFKKGPIRPSPGQPGDPGYDL